VERQAGQGAADVIRAWRADVEIPVEDDTGQINFFMSSLQVVDPFCAIPFWTDRSNWDNGVRDWYWTEHKVNLGMQMRLRTVITFIHVARPTAENGYEMETRDDYRLFFPEFWYWHCGCGYEFRAQCHVTEHHANCDDTITPVECGTHQRTNVCYYTCAPPRWHGGTE
jgi:hypothetical protein